MIAGSATTRGSPWGDSGQLQEQAVRLDGRNDWVRSEPHAAEGELRILRATARWPPKSWRKIERHNRCWVGWEKSVVPGSGSCDCIPPRAHIPSTGGGASDGR